jgi:hypothetical protein
MQALVKYRDDRGLTRPIIEWKYLLFNWNDHRSALEDAIAMARDARVDMISFWPTSNPFFAFSWRYRLCALNDIGVACWKGRELVLRPDVVDNAVTCWKPAPSAVAAPAIPAREHVTA